MEFDKIYLIYDSISNGSSSYNALKDVLSIKHDKPNALFEANSVFHRRGDNPRYPGAMTSTDANKFLPNQEARLQRTLIEELNKYIDNLTYYRYGDSKILSLVALFTFDGLLSMVKLLNIPTHLVPAVDSVLDYLYNESSKYLTETREYILKNYPQVDENYLYSLGTSLLMQRSDQVVNTLARRYGEELRDLVEYLMTQRYYYNKLTTTISQKQVLSLLGISSSAYDRNKNSVITDFHKSLSPELIQYLSTFVVAI